MATGPNFTIPGGGVTGPDFSYGPSTAESQIEFVWAVGETEADSQVDLLWGYPVDNEVSLVWSLPADSQVGLLWGVGSADRTVDMLWGYPVDNEVSLVWSLPADGQVDVLWGYPTNQEITLPWAVLGLVDQQVDLRWAMTTQAESQVDFVWSDIAVDEVVSQVDLSWSNLAAPSAQLLAMDQQLKVVETGEIIPFESADLQADESSWAWRFSARISDATGWQKLRPNSGPVEIEISARGNTWLLLCEGAGRQRAGNGTSYQIKGRSITAKLARGLADQVTNTWLASTAKTIAQQQCDAADITLDWQAVDWPISRYEVVSQYPIDIINQLAKAVGAIVQTEPDGTLLVRPKYALSPALYGSVSPDHIFSDIDDMTSLSESWEPRPGYDSIEVGNETIRDEPSITLRTTDAGSGAVSVQADVVPFQSIDLEHSAGLNLDLQYQGIKTEIISDTVEIVEGVGRLSRPFYGVITSAWRYTDLGGLDISESGEIIADVGLHSLLDISYTTQYHEWRATSNADQVQVYIEGVA